MTKFAVIASGAWQSINLNTNSALWIATLCFRKAQNDKTLSLLLSFCDKINTNQNFCAIIWNEIYCIIFVKFNLGAVVWKVSHEARFARAMGKAFVILSVAKYP